MPQINVLDQLTIDKIAAGEVVERPSSVAKELIENAIDAGATAITVEIKDGGISLLRVTDNGCGIDKEQVRKAFLRHSTSKIVSINDLESIHSLGFRGEALSSISAVAQVELLTKTRDALVGVRYIIEGGKEIALEDIGLPDGTTIIIKNIFFNTPARQKFLKTPMTEGSYISALVEHLAMSHPEISFNYKMNGQIKLQTSGNGSLKDVLYQIYGIDVIKNLIEINASNDRYSLRGYIGKPVLSRGNRNYENYFVNGRYVTDKIMSKAIEDGYKNYMMQHQFPFTLIFAQMDGSFVDVNVHPAKAQVRFNDEKGFYDFVRESVENALAQKDFIPDIPLAESPKEEGRIIQAAPRLTPDNAKLQTAAEPFENSLLEKVKKQAAESALSHETEQDSHPVNITQSVQEEVVKSPDTVAEYSNTRNNAWDIKVPDTYKDDFIPQSKAEYIQESFIEKDTDKLYFKLIGQVFDTYWIMEFDRKMYIVDQHAAHEKVNYERFVKRFKDKTFSSQQIMPPVIVTLSPQEEQLIHEYADEFRTYGFEIEPFGGKEYAISAVPTDLYGMNEKEFFESLVDEFSNSVRIENEPDMFLHKIATAACKASVKGHDRISFAEAEVLLKELFNAEQPYHCPHGRPTMISMTVKEIEKMFKRII